MGTIDTELVLEIVDKYLDIYQEPLHRGLKYYSYRCLHECECKVNCLKELRNELADFLKAKEPKPLGIKFNGHGKVISR